MDSLQELITRGRFVCAQAPGRHRVFELVNGKRTAKDIATQLSRHVNNIRRDLNKLLDVGLLREREKSDGSTFRKDGYVVYEKVPLARAIPARYFVEGTQPAKVAASAPAPSKTERSSKQGLVRTLPVPSEQNVLDICRAGEDQLHEFKGPGTDVRKITREIAAMANTRDGGMVLYGVDDSGTILGSDVSRQTLDQPLQNSVRNSISPAVTVHIHTVKVMGSDVLVVIVPGWNRKDVYQFDDKVLIRKGTNVFAAKPEESKRLHRGEYVV